MKKKKFQETSDKLHDLRNKLTDSVASSVDSEELTAEEGVIATLQAAAVLLLCLDGDKPENIRWGVENFLLAGESIGKEIGIDCSFRTMSSYKGGKK